MLQWKWKLWNVAAYLNFEYWGFNLYYKYLIKYWYIYVNIYMPIYEYIYKYKREQTKG